MPPNPSKRRPPPAKHPLPPPQGRGKKGPEHPPPPLRLRTLNTSYLFRIRDLASLSVTPGSMPSCAPTPTKPGSSGEARMTSPLSLLASSTLTTTPPPLDMHRLPLVVARVARQKKKGRPPPPNKLRVRRLPQLRRGRPHSLVPNEHFVPPPVACRSSRRPRHSCHLPRHGCSRPSPIQLPPAPRFLGHGQPPRFNLTNCHRQGHSSCIIRPLLRRSHKGPKPVIPGW